MYHGFSIRCSACAILFKMSMKCSWPGVQTALLISLLVLCSDTSVCPRSCVCRACGTFTLIKPLNKCSGEQDPNHCQQLASINIPRVMCFLAVPVPHYYLRERVALYGEEKQLRACRTLSERTCGYESEESTGRLAVRIKMTLK